MQNYCPGWESGAVGALCQRDREGERKRFALWDNPKSNKTNRINQQKVIILSITNLQINTTFSLFLHISISFMKRSLSLQIGKLYKKNCYFFLHEKKIDNLFNLHKLFFPLNFICIKMSVIFCLTITKLQPIFESGKVLRYYGPLKKSLT